MRVQLEGWSLSFQEFLPLNRSCDCICWALSLTSTMNEELWIRRSKHAKKEDRRNWVGPISGSTEWCVKHGTPLKSNVLASWELSIDRATTQYRLDYRMKTACSIMQLWSLPSVGDSRASASLKHRRHHSCVIELLTASSFSKLMRVMRCIVQQQYIERI